MVTSAMAEFGETLFEEDKILFLVVAYLSLQGSMQDVTPEKILPKLKSARLAEIVESFLMHFPSP